MTKTGWGFLLVAFACNEPVVTQDAALDASSDATPDTSQMDAQADASELDSGQPADAAVDAAEDASLDGAIADAGVDGSVTDAAVADAGAVDGAMSDAGMSMDAEVPVDAAVTGVTCVVSRRAGCVQSTETYSNVSFRLHPVWTSFGPAGLTSPLSAFQEFYNTPGPPVMHANEDGTGFTFGADVTPNITIQGLHIEVDIDAVRQGLMCAPDTVGPPLIAVRCTGSTYVTVAECRAPHAFHPQMPRLTCTVTRRDASCIAQNTQETPRSWFAAGQHNSTSELYLQSPAITEANGGALRLFQEHPCDSYSSNSVTGENGVVRQNNQIWADGIQLASGGTCRDNVGLWQPRFEVNCSGESEVGTAP